MLTFYVECPPLGWYNDSAMSRPGDSCEYKPHRQLLVDLLCPEEEAWQFLSIYADIIRTVLHNPYQNWPHVDNDGFAEGKCEWMKLFPGRLNVTQTAQVDLWGNEEDLFVSRLYSSLETAYTSNYQSRHCPARTKRVTTQLYIYLIIF